MALVFDTAVGEDFDIGTGTVTKFAPGSGTFVGTQISISTLGLQGATTVAATATWAPGAILNLGQATTTITFSGAAIGDFVLPSASIDLLGLQLTAYVNAANTVTLVLTNLTGATVTPASFTAKVLPLRPR